MDGVLSMHLVVPDPRKQAQGGRKACAEAGERLEFDQQSTLSQL